MKIAVFGDICLDIEMHGTSERLAQEDPTAVVHANAPMRYSLGMAGNVAMTLALNGHDVQLLSRVGTDDAGYRVIELLKDFDIPPFDIIQDPGITTTKVRCYGTGRRLIGRWDHDKQFDPKSALRPVMHDWSDLDALILSDYDKGVFATDVQRLRTIPEDLPVVADMKCGVGPESGIDVWYALPNQSEFEARMMFSAQLTNSKTDLQNFLRPKARVTKAVVATCGADGAAIHRPGYQWAPIPALVAEYQALFTVGAGDVFAAAFAVAIAEEKPVRQATEFAVHQASRYAVTGGRKWETLP